MLTFIEKLTQNDKKKKEKQSLLEQERMYNQKDWLYLYLNDSHHF